MEVLEEALVVLAADQVTGGVVRQRQRVGQDGQPVERPLVVDRLGHRHQCAVVPAQPGGLHLHRAEWVDDNLAQQRRLRPLFGVFALKIGLHVLAAFRL